MRFLAFLCLSPLLLAACLHARAGIIEDIHARLDRIELRLAAGDIPPSLPPVVHPTPPAPVPPATGPSCTPGGSYLINGMGTIYNVCACPSATVQLRNMIPGNSISFAKMPGTGTPAVPLGLVTVTEGGTFIGSSGTGGQWPIGVGDRATTFTAQACTNLVVQVR